MLPVFSSWIVWCPVSIGVYLSGRPLAAVAVAAVHVLAEIYVDTMLQSFIPGHSYFVGLSVLLGMMVFGGGGAWTGPLLTGMTATVVDMYRDYIHVAHQQQREVTSFQTDEIGKNLVQKHGITQQTLRSADLAGTRQLKEIQSEHFVQSNGQLVVF